MRYYAVNKNGEIVAESESKKVLEYYILSNYGFDEKRIGEEEIEIVEGRNEMIIKITYKNGTVLTNKVHYVTTMNDKLYYARAMNPAPVVQPPTSIPLEYVESFKVIVEGEEE